MEIISVIIASLVSVYLVFAWVVSSIARKLLVEWGVKIPWDRFVLYSLTWPRFLFSK